MLGAWVRRPRHPAQKILGSGHTKQPAPAAQHLSSTSVPPRCTAVSLCACCAGILFSAAAGAQLALQPDSSPLEADPLWAAGSCSICLASCGRLSLGCCSVLRSRACCLPASVEGRRGSTFGRLLKSPGAFVKGCERPHAWRAQNGLRHSCVALASHSFVWLCCAVLLSVGAVSPLACLLNMSPP